MRQTLWVALDVCHQSRRRRAGLILAVFMILWLSFQSGLVEGAAEGMPRLWGQLVKRSLFLRGLWPGLALATLTAELLFTRRQKREMEPLLVSAGIGPALGGCLLPALAGLPLLAILSLPPILVGIEITSQSGWDRIPAELAWNLLAVPAAGLWVLASMTGAALKASNATTLMLRSLPGFIPVMALEAGILAMRWSGWQPFEPLLLSAAMVTGMAALVRVIGGQTCEGLIREVPADA